MMMNFWFKKKLRVFQPKREKKQHNKREREREKREKIFFLLLPFYTCTNALISLQFFSSFVLYLHHNKSFTQKD